MKKSIYLIILLSLIQTIIYSKGIIIANDSIMLKTFRDENTQYFKNMAEHINKNYDETIIHLGKETAYKKGSLFFYKTSKENLKTLLDNLKTKKYIWFLDSYGSEEFEYIYQNYETIAKENLKFLENLNIEYDGIAIDLEWINLNSNFQNNKKMIEIVKNLKKIIGKKKLFLFSSIIEDEKENSLRGYDESELSKYATLVPMIYIKDFGYYLHENKLKLNFNENRLENLLKYFNSKNYKISYSLESGIILHRNQNLYFIKTINNIDSLYSKTKQIYIDEQKHYKIEKLIVIEDLYIQRNDSLYEKILQNEEIYFLKINPEAVENSFWIWEYFIYYD